MYRQYIYTLIGLLVLSLGLVSCGDEGPSAPGPDDRRAKLYVTNNSNGDISVIDVVNDFTRTIGTPSSAAEGIYYDADDDVAVQASRSANQLNAFVNFSEINDGRTVESQFSSSSDLESPREIAVSGNRYVVSDNGSDRFFIYNRNDESGFTLRNTISVPFPVWGITFKGDDLYAVVDTENELAVFYDFLSNSSNGTVNPSKRVTIQGIVRTHGLTYNGSDDVMVMTDIGDAGNAQSDGGFHVIPNFSQQFDALADGDVLRRGQQIRVAGSSTLLGNPIDVAYDPVSKAIYISEIGNGGGRVLGFTNYQGQGDIAPTLNQPLAGASSIYFSSDETDGDTGTETDASAMQSQLYVTNNANGVVNTFNLAQNSSGSFDTESDASEGIFFSGVDGAVIQASRSNNTLQYYGGTGSSRTADFTSNAVLPSPREIAVAGNKVVVSDNSSHQFFVYTFDGSRFQLINTFDLPYNVWGITFMGDDLLSVVDGTSDLAVFNDFLDNYTSGGTINPDKRITIQGIVRTHGITFSRADNVLVMTDIGLASNGSTDGGFHVIRDASTKLGNVQDGGTLALTQQVRVAGPSTMMGNPIDVAYNHKTNAVFVAEVGNGKVLGFNNIGSGGNLAPNALNVDLPAASSIYFYGN